ncbi:MAG: hypothetical protein JW969_20390 [Spirochaetales bacterium]|nr:hypothetical protein [Spirochaetales bacterium]
MTDKIFSPDFVFHQLNGGGPGSGYPSEVFNIVCNIGAATWKLFPYNDQDGSTWPTEKAWRQAAYYRGEKPDENEWGTLYYIRMKTDDQINIVKTLLANNILVNITVDANRYADLSEDDVWDKDNYPDYSLPNHGNIIVGYFD